MSDQPKSSEREQLLALLDRATDVEVLACFEGMPEAVRRSHKNELLPNGLGNSPKKLRRHLILSFACGNQVARQCGF